MKFPEFKWIGYKESLASVTKMFDLTKENENIPIPSESEAYFSIFRFKDEMPSLRDVPEETPFYSDFFYFDFDSKDLALALKDAQELIKRFDFVGAKTELYFSGNKGFHVALPSGYVGFEPISKPEKVKNFCALMARGLETFDKSVYNKTRIIRCPWSRNLATGLFKIPLELDVLYTTEAIRAQASVQLEKSFCPLDKEERPVIKALKEIFETAPTYTARVVDEESKFTGSVFMKAGEGNRNESAFSVARKLARRGVSLSDAKLIMSRVWNEEHCNPPLSAYELNKVIENAYERGVNEVLEEGQYESKISDITKDIGLVSKSYRTGSGGFLTGYKMLDDFTMGFQPGESIFIAARSGNFKSAFLTNILQRGSRKLEQPALFFSMEMGRETLVPRAIQLSEGMTKKQVLEAFKAGKTLRDFEKTVDDFKYVKFIYLSNLSTEQIMGLIDFHKEKYGQPCAIGFDYMGLFKGCNNNTERTAKQAQEIKSVIGRAAGCPIFTLAQAKQIYEGRRGDIELDRVCGKDSDGLLDLGDYGIGLWGHWDSDEQGNERKYIFGKFYKSRGMDAEVYGPDPYFALAIEDQFMRVNDVIHVPNPPRFKQKDKSQDE